MLLTIPRELMDLNRYVNIERGNRYGGAEIKSRETQLVKFHAYSQKLPKVKNQVYIIFRWYCKNKKKDPDNIAFAKKFILDGLVSNGTLQGDGWKHIEGFQDEFYVDPENPRVEVEIV